MTFGIPGKVADLASAAFVLIALAILVLPAQQASAMELAAKGDTIFLGGAIKPGDSIAFKHFLEQAPKGLTGTSFWRAAAVSLWKRSRSAARSVKPI